jgi:ATP-dependent 26S proteasome regulatory subunit
MAEPPKRTIIWECTGMSVTSADLARLERCLAARHPCISISTGEERYALNLITGASVGPIESLWCWNVVRGLYPGQVERADALPETEHPAAALYYLTRNIHRRSLVVMLDLAPHLSDDRVRRALRDAIQHFREIDATIVLVDHDPNLPPVIAAEAAPLEFSLPGEKELESLIRSTLRRMHREQPVHIKLNKRELRTIVRNLSGLTRHQAQQIVADAVAEDRVFDAEDINRILAQKRQRVQSDGVLEYVEAPVDLSQIGGLRRLKRWLKHREKAMTEQATEFGLGPPRGVLMLGVQGAGKSLCAKAIATAWQRPLLRLDPGALYDRYVGESEARLRGALRQAETMAPIILWIDEIEKGFASAAAHSTDGGLSQRMFGTLLTWMQEHRAPVFLVATANNIEALPPELLRKGRFDEIFFVDLPGKPVRRQILAIHLKKRGRDPDHFDLDLLADASEGYSGSELEQAIVSGLHEAFGEGSELRTAHVLDALRGSPPLSVTMAERVQRLRHWASARCVPAD